MINSGQVIFSRRETWPRLSISAPFPNPPFLSSVYESVRAPFFLPSIDPPRQRSLARLCPARTRWREADDARRSSSGARWECALFSDNARSKRPGRENLERGDACTSFNSVLHPGLASTPRTKNKCERADSGDKSSVQKYAIAIFLFHLLCSFFFFPAKKRPFSFIFPAPARVGQSRRWRENCGRPVFFFWARAFERIEEVGDRWRTKEEEAINRLADIQRILHTRQNKINRSVLNLSEFFPPFLFKNFTPWTFSHVHIRFIVSLLALSLFLPSFLSFYALFSSVQKILDRFLPAGNASLVEALF